MLLTGLGTGLAAGLLMKLLQAVQHVGFGYDSGNFLHGVQQTSSLRRVLVVGAGGVVACLGLFALRHGSGGTGGKLNERIWFHSGRLAVGKTIAQGVLSIVIVGLGGSVGRESAPKQTGAAIASWLSRQAGLSSAETRLLAACGAGAGIAAVYNVPFGGALFSLEVMLGTLALPLIPPALVTSFVATAMGWWLLPNQPTYAVFDYPVVASQMVWAAGFGPIAGLMSVLYVRLMLNAGRLIPGFVPKALAPIPVFIALGLLAIAYPQLLGNGKDVAQLGFVGALGLPLLFALAFLKPLATAFCLGSGAPGGLFTPSITFGALLGGSLGKAWALLWPGAAPGSYAMIGTAAVLAATMQAPIAAIVLLLELTHHINMLMVPILFAVAGAAVTARRIDPRSVYSGHVVTGKRAAVPPQDGPGPGSRQLRLATANSISAAAGYAEVLQRLLANPAPLYVVNETARLCGRIETARLAQPHALTEVLSAGAASDLMTALVPLHETTTDAETLVRLAAEPSGELPVVAEDTGQILWVVSRR